jgi:hypothetical protein
MNERGRWLSSIPPEITQLMSEPYPSWDWQVRDIDDEEWFVARLIDNNKCQRIVAGRVAAVVEEPPPE